MLQTFREHSGGIFAKIIFGLIIASFALFGVGDMFRHYINRHPIATIGGTTISQEEFRFDYDQMLRNVQAVFKGKISPEQIKTLNLQTRVLDGLVDRTLIQNDIKNLGLVVSNEVLAQTIRSVPAFHNEKGNFDDDRFRDIIRSHGRSESNFTNQIKLDLQQQQLFLPLSKGINLSQNYQEKLYKALHQEYIFETLYIPLSSIKITETPEQTDLESLYKKNEELFTRPEYRDIRLLVVEPMKIQATIQPTEEQILEEYQRRQPEFVIPETRFVTQATFTSKETGIKAHERVAAGEPIDQVTKELGGKLQNFPQAHREQFSHAHADLIFKEAHPFVTNLTDSLLGWSIFSIAQITPASQKPLDSVREKIIDDLKIRLTGEKMDELRNKIEDELAGGETPENVAKSYKLDVINIGKITDKGINPNKESAIPEEYRPLVLDNAFTLESGTGTPVLDGIQGKMVVVHVHQITPKTLPPLNEIKDEVTNYWIKIKQQEAASKKGSDFAKEATSTAILADIAKKNNYVLKTLPPLSLTSLQENKKFDDVLSSSTLQKEFKPVNHADVVPAKDGFVVIMTKEILPLSVNKEDEKWKKFQQYLKNMFSKDFQTEYLKALKTTQKVDIDHSVLNRLISAEGGIVPSEPIEDVS